MFSRRNLTPYQRSELALELEPLIREKAKEKLKLSQGRGVKGRKEKGLQNSATNKIDTRKELFDTAGVSHDTIMRSKYIKEHADEDTKKKRIDNRESTINREYTQLSGERY